MLNTAAPWWLYWGAAPITIFKENLKPHVDSFELDEYDCKLFFKEVSDPRRYGVGVFKGKTLIQIEEKPEKPKTNLACVGIYFYNKNVFEAIDNVGPSLRGEGTMDSYHNTNWIVHKEV